MAPKFTAHAVAYGIPCGLVSCASVLNILRGVRGKLGIPPVIIQPTAAPLTIVQPASSRTIFGALFTQPPAFAPRHSTEHYWIAVACLGWTTVDDRVISEAELEGKIDSVSAVMPLGELIAWMDWMVGESQRQCRAMSTWDSDSIYAIIALGHATYASALAEPAILEYLVGQGQDIDLATFMADYSGD